MRKLINWLLGLRNVDIRINGQKFYTIQVYKNTSRLEAEPIAYKYVSKCKNIITNPKFQLLEVKWHSDTSVDFLYDYPSRNIVTKECRSEDVNKNTHTCNYISQ